MDLSELKFDIKGIVDNVESIKDSELKQLYQRYHDSMDNTLTSLTIPLIFMAIGARESMQFQYVVRGNARKCNEKCRR